MSYCQNSLAHLVDAEKGRRKWNVCLCCEKERGTQEAVTDNILGESVKRVSRC